MTAQHQELQLAYVPPGRVQCLGFFGQDLTLVEVKLLAGPDWKPRSGALRHWSPSLGKLHALAPLGRPATRQPQSWGEGLFAFALHHVIQDSNVFPCSIKFPAGAESLFEQLLALGLLLATCVQSVQVRTTRSPSRMTTSSCRRHLRQDVSSHSQVPGLLSLSLCSLEPFLASRSHWLLKPCKAK